MKRYNMNWSVKKLCKETQNNKVNFDIAVQRGQAWDIERDSLLIHSTIYGYAVPPLFFRKDESGVYEALDGKQREGAWERYINGEYALHETTPCVYNEQGEEEDISGCYFENLPEWCKDVILDYSLTIYYFEDMTEEEVREFFRRINNGKPLTAIELTRVKAKSIDAFQRIANHDVVIDSISAKGKQRYTDELITMQVYAMDKMENLDFGNKAFRPWIQEAIVDSVSESEIINGLDYVKHLFDSVAASLEADATNKQDKRVAKKIRTRTNFVSIAYAGILASRNNKDMGEFGTAVYKFFDCTTTSTSTVYNSSVGAGSARSENVHKRKTAMQDLVASI